MIKYHVEFDVEAQRSWRPSASDSVQWTTNTKGFQIWIPGDATITEIAEPVKVGDVLATLEDVDRAPGGTIARQGNYAYRKFLGSSPSHTQGWWKDGVRTILGREALQQNLPLTVLYVPEQSE